MQLCFRSPRWRSTLIDAAVVSLSVTGCFEPGERADSSEGSTATEEPTLTTTSSSASGTATLGEPSSSGTATTSTTQAGGSTSAGSDTSEDGESTRGDIDPLPGCGNGTPDDGEECDDGNSDDADYCLSNCRRHRCGDGYHYPEFEPCDDGNEDNTDDCTSSCRRPYCGDGYVHRDDEDCDDGNTLDDDHCPFNCVFADTESTGRNETDSTDTTTSPSGEESSTTVEPEENPCDGSPCLNGGQCVPGDGQDYSCNCSRTAYTGDHCEVCSAHTLTCGTCGSWRFESGTTEGWVRDTRDAGGTRNGVLNVLTTQSQVHSGDYALSVPLYVSSLADTGYATVSIQLCEDGALQNVTGLTMSIDIYLEGSSAFSHYTYLFLEARGDNAFAGGPVSVGDGLTLDTWHHFEATFGTGQGTAVNTLQVRLVPDVSFQGTIYLDNVRLAAQ